MVNIGLTLFLVAFLSFIVYEQVITSHLNGKTLINIPLKRKAHLDTFIFISLIGVLLYQTGLQISSLTLFLLSLIIVASLYIAFIRTPRLLFKQKGFYFNAFFVDYRKISEIKLSQDNYILFYLTNGKCLTALSTDKQAQSTILTFLNKGKHNDNSKASAS